MFYVAHFSFDGQENLVGVEEDIHGWFTCLVEAESIDLAVDKLRELVNAHKSWFTGFNSVDNVYLDDVTEVKGLPEQGVLAHFHEAHSSPPPTISTSLHGIPREFCESYGWSADEEEDDGNGVAVEPFVSFEE